MRARAAAVARVVAHGGLATKARPGRGTAWTKGMMPRAQSPCISHRILSHITRQRRARPRRAPPRADVRAATRRPISWICDADTGTGAQDRTRSRLSRHFGFFAFESHLSSRLNARHRPGARVRVATSVALCLVTYLRTELHPSTRPGTGRAPGPAAPHFSLYSLVP